jgi:hypothetical protein
MFCNERDDLIAVTNIVFRLVAEAESSGFGRAGASKEAAAIIRLLEELML